MPVPGVVAADLVVVQAGLVLGFGEAVFAYELGEDKLYAHQAAQDARAVPGVLPLPAHLYPPEIRIAIICDNYSPHLTTARDAPVGTWASANNVEIAYAPSNASWLNRIEAQFTALRYFTLDGTDHATHKEHASMIRRYIIWRNDHAYDQKLRRIVDRANVA
jgi:transposase